MSACPLFVELCCGSAAVSLGLIGGTHARPPVSYQGSKRGYFEPILWTLGLRSGQGADALLLNDPGPWSRVWRVLVDPEGCRRVAEIIRGWIGEDARALWERLRAEPVPEDEGEAAARWCYLQTKHHNGIEVGTASGRFVATSYKADAAATEKGQTARFLPEPLRVEIGAYIRERREAAGLTRRQVDDACGVVTACSWWEGRPRGTRPPSWPVYQRLKPLLGLDDRYDAALSSVTTRTVKIDDPGTWKVNVPDADDIAPRYDALSRLRFPPGTLVLDRDAAGIEPREVARWVFMQGRAISGMADHSAFNDYEARAVRGTRGEPATERTTAERLDALPPLPAAVSNLPAEDIHPVPPLPEGTCVYLDPPYSGDGSRKITGYAHQFPRASVVDVAERWKAAGARVAVSECVALPELLERGWYSVEVTGTRKGQRRTFSAQSREWLTLSHPPAWAPCEQPSLFPS